MLELFRKPSIDLEISPKTLHSLHTPPTRTSRRPHASSIITHDYAQRAAPISHSESLTPKPVHRAAAIPPSPRYQFPPPNQHTIIMKPIIPILAALVTVTLTPSCVNRVADLTFASTKNIDLNAPNSYTTNTTQRVSGKDTSHIIITFPTGNPSPKEAIDRAIEQSGANCIGLSNVVIYGGSWYIPYIYGKSWYEVQGNPVYKN